MPRVGGAEGGPADGARVHCAEFDFWAGAGGYLLRCFECVLGPQQEG